jgi:hypothetical protein
MRSYLTHCSAKKDDSLKATRLVTTPDKLYSSTFIRRFTSKFIEKGVRWAIFSDLYSVWFSHVEHGWYDKHPDTVTEDKFHELVRDFNEKLRGYDEIWFYYELPYYHPFYDRLLRATACGEKIKKFSDLELIG